MSTFLHQLHDAVETFEVLAAAREPSRAEPNRTERNRTEPNRTMVITGALGLSALCDRRIGGQTMIDAEAILTAIATGGPFNLDGPNRLRYERLAEVVCRHLSALESIKASQAADRHSLRRAVTC